MNHPLLTAGVVLVGSVLSFLTGAAVVELVWNSWFVSSFHAPAIGLIDATELTLIAAAIIAVIYFHRV